MKSAKTKKFVKQGFGIGESLVDYFAKTQKKSHKDFKVPKKIVRFLEVNNLVMLSSIYDAIPKKQKAQKAVIYQAFLKCVPNKGYYNLCDTGYCADYAVEENYAMNFIASLESIGYSCKKEELLYFDKDDYILYLEHDIERMKKYREQWNSYKESKLVEPKYYKRESIKEKEEDVVIDYKLEGYRQQNIDRMDKNELKMKSILDNIGVKYLYQEILFTGSNFFIADFYLPDNNIIIEIDGGVHFSMQQLIKDRIRDAEFARLGVLTIRYDVTDPFFGLDVRHLSKIVKKDLGL